jgi:hypothetical protein
MGNDPISILDNAIIKINELIRAKSLDLYGGWSKDGAQIAILHTIAGLELAKGRLVQMQRDYLKEQLAQDLDDCK